jgi:hypothetical protein
MKTPPKSHQAASSYNAFDACHVKHDLSAMEGLLAGYINARLDTYLKILQESGAF